MTTYSQLSEVLANGEWVRHGLIWRWRENEPEPVTPPRRAAHDYIACPTCLARMDEHCRRTNNKAREHDARLVKRVCSCGGPIRPREPMCGFCRAEMTRSVA